MSGLRPVIEVGKAGGGFGWFQIDRRRLLLLAEKNPVSRSAERLADLRVVRLARFDLAVLPGLVGPWCDVDLRRDLVLLEAGALSEALDPFADFG